MKNGIYIAIVCIFFLCTLPSHAEITEGYSVHPEDTGKPDIDKRIVIDRTEVTQVIMAVRALQQIRNEHKASLEQLVADYNALISQLNAIITACGLGFPQLQEAQLTYVDP